MKLQKYIFFPHIMKGYFTTISSPNLSTTTAIFSTIWLG